MNDLERFRATLEYQPRDRAPLKEFPWPAWPETADRWAKEGGYDPVLPKNSVRRLYQPKGLTSNCHSSRRCGRPE